MNLSKSRIIFASKNFNFYELKECLLIFGMTKVIIVFYNVLRGCKMTKLKKYVDENLRPTQILVLGFLFFIIVGTILLSLPVASNGETASVVDAFFTATSAVCVTGLVVVNTAAQWSAFGKVVIIVLIQFGGLGFMTFATSIFLILGRKIGLKDRLVIQEALNQSELSGMVRLIRNILIGTFIIEGVGAVLLSIRFVKDFGARGILFGIFHAISAFCNAGFDILGDNSLMNYIGDPTVNIVVMLLIVLGGLGFTVWTDTIATMKKSVEKKWKLKTFFDNLSLHSKLVYVSTIFLISAGFIIFLVVEWKNGATIGSEGFGTKVLASLFQSVTTRTAGFNTMNLPGMKDVSKFISIILMFIGGSPAGTAGGIKTITVVVLFIEVMAIVEGKDTASAFKRTISTNTIRKALAVIIISFAVVLSITSLLTLTESSTFLNLLFEAVSAFATVGLTLGETANLTFLGKIIIAVTMFIGRLGPLTMAVAINISGGGGSSKVKLPEGKVMVG